MHGHGVLLLSKQLLDAETSLSQSTCHNTRVANFKAVCGDQRECTMRRQTIGHGVVLTFEQLTDGGDLGL
jgi:hypothetical protein